jgi:hypothetical protein
VILYAGDLDYDSNWLGGQEIAPMAKVKDFGTAGFSKDHYERWNRTWASQQAGLFSFSRIYEAGHEATFYQPLMAYTLFERALMGMDVATGTVLVNDGFLTTGPATDTLRQGNSSILESVTPGEATFNIATGRPQVNAVVQAMRRKKSGSTRREVIKRFQRK